MVIALTIKALFLACKRPKGSEVIFVEWGPVFSMPETFKFLNTF